MFNKILFRFNRGGGSLLEGKVYSESDRKIIVSAANFKIEFSCNSIFPFDNSRHDFAVWALLPIAMVTGRNLHIHGTGTKQTVSNAQKMSEIWSSWMPTKFNPVDVSFDNYAEVAEIFVEKNKPELLFFSGGIDSTYTLLSREWKFGKPDLLTVQGMDYKSGDDLGFLNASKKTLPVTNEYAGGRIYLNTNAYNAYKPLKISGQLSFIFVLSAAGFLYERLYKNCVISADFCLYQQFEVFPYGSTFVTNPLFSSGNFMLLTHGDDVARAEKVIPINDSKSALESISFCKDKKIRPHNCGVCIKCLRTKYMFIASTGSIPQVPFINSGLKFNSKLRFSNHKNRQKSFVFDTYYAAKRHGNLEKIPSIVAEYHRLRK